MCAALDLDPRDGDLQGLLELRRVAFVGGNLQLVRDVGEIIVRGPGGVRHGERDTAGGRLHRCQSSHEKGLEQRVRPSRPENTSCSAGRSIRPRLRCTTTHAGSCGGGRSGTRRPGQLLVISPTRIGGEERCLNASASLLPGGLHRPGTGWTSSPSSVRPPSERQQDLIDYLRAAPLGTGSSMAKNCRGKCGGGGYNVRTSGEAGPELWVDNHLWGHVH